MSHRQDDAYVLGTLDLGDADLIVTLLAENAGRVRGVARSARRSRRRFGGALEPMSRVRAAWSEREGRELHRIESLDLARSYAAMQAEPARQAACAVLAEVSAAVARESEADALGFRLLGAVLDALEGGADPWVAIRYFEYWTLRLHGVLPDLRACASCGNAVEGRRRPRAAPGALLCDSCARTWPEACAPFRGRDEAFLRDAAVLPPADLAGHSAAAAPGGSLEVLLRRGLESFAERTFRTYRHLAAQAGPVADGRGGR